jgi:hypothetical protein
MWSVSSVKSCIAACLNDNNCAGFSAVTSDFNQCVFLSELTLIVDVENTIIGESPLAADDIFATADCTKVATSAPPPTDSDSGGTPPPADSDSDGSRVPTSSMLLGLAASLTAPAVTIAVD